MQDVALQVSKGAAQREWSSVSEDSLWASVVRADSVVDVGLRMPGSRKGIDDRGKVLVARSQAEVFR